MCQRVRAHTHTRGHTQAHTPLNGQKGREKTEQRREEKENNTPPLTLFHSAPFSLSSVSHSRLCQDNVTEIFSTVTSQYSKHTHGWYDRYPFFPVLCSSGSSKTTLWETDGHDHTDKSTNLSYLHTVPTFCDNRGKFDKMLLSNGSVGKENRALRKHFCINLSSMNTLM